MKKGGIGGANTKTGLLFEGRVDLVTLLKDKEGYTVKNEKIFYNGKEVALTFKKNGLYRYLEKNGVDYKKFISKKLLPDNVLYVIANNTVFVIEVKFQHVAGSVDEKLQTCDFKIMQYRKLFSKLNVEVEYMYILSEWFQRPEYKDTLDYVISIKGCSYYFHYIPLKRLGLPVPSTGD